MFALTDADLTRRILDCPAGAASFVARAPTGYACDLAYANTSGPALLRHVQADNERLNRYIRLYPDQYHWTYFTGADQHRTIRRASAERFAADRDARPSRYLPGALPELPFAARAFELVLSSHFLFTYADRFDQDFHRAALRELVRVSSDEVRIFPLVPIALSTPYQHLDELRAELAEDGTTTSIVDVDYEFQAGGNQMLVCLQG